MITTHKAAERTSNALKIKVEVCIDSRCEGDKRISAIHMQAEDGRLGGQCKSVILETDSTNSDL
jgi:hypothetical protein